jgi:hypothetical protein
MSVIISENHLEFHGARLKLRDKTKPSSCTMKALTTEVWFGWFCRRLRYKPLRAHCRQRWGFEKALPSYPALPGRECPTQENVDI